MLLQFLSAKLHKVSNLLILNILILLCILKFFASKIIITIILTN